VARKKPDMTHLSAEGKARMVDVGDKRITAREARAEGWIRVGARIARRLRETGALAKGDVLETARLAGIMAAKRTSGLIPMCHPLPLDVVEMEAEVEDDRVRLSARVRCRARTGVEMEALTAVAVACLTVYDMVKSAAKGIEIGPIRLVEKSGGRSGRWTREKSDHGTG